MTTHIGPQNPRTRDSRKRNTRHRCLLFCIPLLAPLSAAETASAQFWARILNPKVTVAIHHQPAIGTQVDTVMFGPSSGECSDEVVRRLVARLVGDEIRVVNRQELDLVLTEHRMNQDGWVDPESAREMDDLFGASMMVSVVVTRCATEQVPSYYDRVEERTDPQTEKTYSVVVREFASKTTAYLSVSVRITDMATGAIVSLIVSDHAPDSANYSTDGQPVFPPEYEVLDIAHALVHEDVTRELLGWTETRELVYYDDEDCGLKQAHTALKAGRLEQTLEMSLRNLEACESQPRMRANKLARAYYNAGMSLVVLGRNEESLGYLRRAAELDDGGIVQDAIASVEETMRLEAERRAREETERLELARRDEIRRQREEEAAANTLTNADVVTLIEQGIPEALVIRKIETSECRFNTSTAGLVALTAAGVPENIILAMMDADCEDPGVPHASCGEIPAGATSAAAAGSNRWCASDQAVEVSFRLENGKTASICRDAADVLVYSFGTPGEAPELQHRGPVLGSVRTRAVLWGEGVGSLAKLADALAGDAYWIGDSGGLDPDDLAGAAAAPGTAGFYVVYGMTGQVGQSTYVFRRGGWEYALSTTSGRPVAVEEDELEEYESQKITVLSPAGEVFTLR